MTDIVNDGRPVDATSELGWQVEGLSETEPDLVILRREVVSSLKELASGEQIRSMLGLLAIREGLTRPEIAAETRRLPSDIEKVAAALSRLGIVAVSDAHNGPTFSLHPAIERVRD
jgi:hypothetical protein